VALTPGWMRSEMMLEKSNQYAAGMQGVIQSPNWTVTRAYYDNVRLCLAIPG
jgi:hypothetical protein